MMQQQVTPQPAPQPTPQAAPQPAPQAHPAAPHEAHPTTLHDFTLNMLSDPHALQAFQLDPEGVLHACGLSDITAVDVHEILPLVLDTVSISHLDVVDQVIAQADHLTVVDQLTAVAGNVQGIGAAGSVTDVVSAPSAITALVKDFSDLGDVSDALDSNILKDDEAVSGLTDLVHHNNIITKVTDVADVADVSHVADSLVGNIDTSTIGHDTIDAHPLVNNVLVKDVANVDVHHVADVTDNVVRNVAQVGDVHNDLGHNTAGNGIGDVKVGDIDVLDHIGNGNDLDLIHL